MKKKSLFIVAVCVLVFTGCGTSENTLSGLESSESGIESQSEGEEAESESIINVESESSTESINDYVAEETTVTNFYEAATTYSAADVEAFAAKIKDLILAEDWETFTNEVGYPLVVDELVIEDSTDLRDLIADSVISVDFVAGIEAESCVEMFCDWQGIAMGELNQVVFGEVPNESGITELKIIALNGMFSK